MNVIDLNGTWTLNILTNTTRFHDMPVTIPGSIVTGALENNLINHPIMEITKTQFNIYLMIITVFLGRLL
ncbi:hypothetical protein Q3408_07810 [Staphylococcus saprophyticus]|nr:hypothetical protein Q3408_07810 [Staphylococcus saprophyticus]